jgi:hypothetical protein
LTPEFLKEFQNSKYEVHQVGSNEAGSQNFSFLALNTAELAASQIFSENPRQRRMTDGFFSALNSSFRYKKSLNVKISNKKKLQVKPTLSIFHMWKVKMQFYSEVCSNQK